MLLSAFAMVWWTQLLDSAHAFQQAEKSHYGRIIAFKNNHGSRLLQLENNQLSFTVFISYEKLMFFWKKVTLLLKLSCLYMTFLV